MRLLLTRNGDSFTSLYYGVLVVVDYNDKYEQHIVSPALLGRLMFRLSTGREKRQVKT
jgi:hypothetical protein